MVQEEAYNNKRRMLWTSNPSHPNFQQIASSELINGYPQLQDDDGRTTNLSMVTGPVGMMINGVAVYRLLAMSMSLLS